MRHSILVFGTALLAGCAAGSPTPDGNDGWVLEREGAGPRLVQSRGIGEEISLQCRGETLHVAVAGFEPVASNEELSIGMEGDAFLLVADPFAPVAAGVVASGTVPRDFFRRLASDETLSAVYGPQRYGPVPTPPPDLAAAFAEGC